MRLNVENKSLGLVFVILRENQRILVNSRETREVVGWKKNDRIRIGYVDGNNHDFCMIDRNQNLPGTFLFTAESLRVGAPPVPKVKFIVDDVIDRSDTYTDDQYRIVARVIQCECTRDGCRCMSTKELRRENCEHLIRSGAVTETQLESILAEMFE